MDRVNYQNEAFIGQQIPIMLRLASYQGTDSDGIEKKKELENPIWAQTKKNGFVSSRAIRNGA